MIGNTPIHQDELKKECHSKIKILEELICYAKSKAIGSMAREEYGNLIAVVLRALTCRVSGTDGLLKQCNYDLLLLFPLYSPIEACNLMPRSYLLVQENINNRNAFLSVRDGIQNEEIVYKTYLSFKSWLLEAVIDFKDQDYAPLSRYEIIRLLADQRGAHFQANMDGRLYKITHQMILPLVFEGERGQYFSNNLYTETIIGIAEELTFSYRHFLEANPQFLRKEGFVYIQKYENEPNYTYKYIRSPFRINAYNSNQHYQCVVSEYEGNIYQIQFRERVFIIAIIDLAKLE